MRLCSTGDLWVKKKKSVASHFFFFNFQNLLETKQIFGKGNKQRKKKKKERKQWLTQIFLVLNHTQAQLSGMT